MSDERAPIFRRFAAGASSPCWASRVPARRRCPAARPTRSRSWFRTWCSPRTRCPGIADLVREHLHRVQRRLRRARADARGPRRQARGQSGAPGQHGASSAPGVRPALQGLYNPGRVTRADGASRAARWKEITWDDAIATAGAEGRRGGRQGRGASPGRGGARFSDLPRRLDRRARRAGGPVRSRSTTSRCGPPTAACSAATSSRRTTSARRSTSSPSAPTSSRPGSRRIENQRGFAESHGFTDGRELAKHVYFAPRASTSPGSTPTSGMPVVPGTETSLALAMARRARLQRARRQP